MAHLRGRHGIIGGTVVGWITLESFSKPSKANSVLGRGMKPPLARVVGGGFGNGNIAQGRGVTSHESPTKI